LQVDVAIVGGGPAGSTLAALLAERGIHVALIDRDTFPRDKLCGEFLSYDARAILDALGLTSAIDAAGATSIRRCRIVAGARASDFLLPATARGISRRSLDQLLFQRAVAAGVQGYDGWFAELAPAPAGRVLLRRDEESVSVDAKVVVGAWGRWGRMDQLLERPFLRARAHRYFGFKRHYRGADANPDLISLHPFDRGYLGVARIEGGMTNICGLVHQSRLAGLKGGWETFVSTLAAEQASLRTLFTSHQPVDAQFLSSEPVIFVPRSPVEKGIFMIGDAAGLIDPLTGDGMAMAMQSALLAAAPVAARLAGRSDAERMYASEFRRFFGGRIRWSRRVAALLRRPAIMTAGVALRLPEILGPSLVARTRAGNWQIDDLIRGWFRSV
jgi:flavin-dependent dehydrogenase